MGLTYLGDSRPVFEPGNARMVYSIPSFIPIEIGDLLLVILVSDPSENAAGIFADGWTLLQANAGTEAHVRVWGKLAGAAEPTTVEVALFGVTLERVGSMLLFRGGGSPLEAIEALDFADFASTTTPQIPASLSQQANIQIALATIETSSSLVNFTGWSTVESYVSTMLSTRRLAVLVRLVRTGILAATAGVISGPATATTGFVWTAVLRARPPFEPAGLVDLVPGNIGLIP